MKLALVISAVLADDMFSSAAKQQARQLQERLQQEVSGLPEQLGLKQFEQQLREAENAVPKPVL